jgi:hypothetical protein
VESLAILGAILVFTGFLAGPIALLLTLKSLVAVINRCSNNIALGLTIFRRLAHGFFFLIGFLLGSFLLFVDVAPLKILGFFSLTTAYLALHIEYLSKNSNFRSKEVLPVYSADGTEIVRAKKVKRFGSSSGRDGHGPGGQH